MTSVAIDTAASPSRSAAPHRVFAVFKLHFVNYGTTIVLPWLILAFIFVVNYAIWWIIFANVSAASDRADAREGLSYSGASFFIFVYMMVVAVQAINLTFPFAQGYSVTRRDFYLGTAAAFATLSVGYAAGLTVLSVIEEATDGWGLGGRMFTSVFLGDGDWYVRFGIFTALFLFFFFVGAAVAAVYVRWRAHGIVAFFAALVSWLVLVVAVISFTSSWPAVGEWFAETGVNGVIAWTLVPTVIAAVAGYLVLRRATPRS